MGAKMEEYADIESGFEIYEDSEIYEITPTPTPIIEENIDSVSDSEISEEVFNNDEFSNDEYNENYSDEFIEEGIEEDQEITDSEIPDNEDLNDEIVQNVQNDNSKESGSSQEETVNIDYSVQLAEINENLEDLQTDKTLNDIYDQLEEIQSQIEVQNDSIISLSNNISFAFRLQTGILVAVWASLIIYIAFSKIR